MTEVSAVVFGKTSSSDEYDPLFEAGSDDHVLNLFQKSSVNGVAVISEHPFRILMPLPFM